MTFQVPPRAPLGLKQPKAKPDPAYLALVRTLPCVIGLHFGEPCRGPIEAHHTICERYGQRKTPDRDAIPLCVLHHRGGDGIHGQKATWIARFGPDTAFIDATRDKITSMRNTQ